MTSLPRGEASHLLGGRDRAPGRIGIGHRDARAAGRRGARDRRRRRRCDRGKLRGRVCLHRRHHLGLNAAVDALDRHRPRVIDLLDALGLEVELVVADLDLVADPQRHPLGDPGVVHPDAVIAAEVLDLDLTVVADDPGMAAGDVPLGEPDRVAFLATDRDLVTDQRDDCRLPFVILDHKLEHRAMCPRGKR
jgi:hypothetical protein